MSRILGCVLALGHGNIAVQLVVVPRRQLPPVPVRCVCTEYLRIYAQGTNRKSCWGRARDVKSQTRRASKKQQASRQIRTGRGFRFRVDPPPISQDKPRVKVGGHPHFARHLKTYAPQPHQDTGTGGKCNKRSSTSSMQHDTEAAAVLQQAGAGTTEDRSSSSSSSSNDGSRYVMPVL
jgi:hypothetical protein